jgi:hypothetical protein
VFVFCAVLVKVAYGTVFASVNIVLTRPLIVFSFAAHGAVFAFAVVASGVRNAGAGFVIV